VRTLDTNVVVRLLIGYNLDRQSRYELLERLVRTRGVVVDDIDAVLDALEQFRQGGATWPISSSLPVPHASVPCRC
jgi:predicted nucleic-acid-binding protein